MDQKVKKQSELMLATMNEILSFKHFKTDIEHCFKLLEENPHPNWLWYNYRNPGGVVPPHLIIEKNHSFKFCLYQDIRNDVALLNFGIRLYDKILWETEIDLDSRGSIDLEFNPMQTSLDISCRHWIPTLPFHCKTTSFEYVVLGRNFYDKLLGLFSELKGLTDINTEDEFIWSEQMPIENITCHFETLHKEDK